jgi:response regulator RpfG family c-di-GMP phosphodiesterase
MSYLIQEISLYLLGAFVIGMIYGWIVRGIRARRDLNNLLDHHEQQIIQLRNENKLLADRVEQLELIPASGGGEDWQDEYPLNEIKDIEASTLSKLASMQISTTKDLWKFCSNDDAVYDLAEKIGVEDFAIQRWVSISQLLRVANIEADDAVLLEATEIYSLEDLSAQKPVRLGEKLAKNNERENILSELPSESKLSGWIEHAQHILNLNR